MGLSPDRGKGFACTKTITACFAVMEVPRQLKTDNGPAYKSERIRKFCQRWGIQHITGIPKSPTGQGIVERANQTLKRWRRNGRKMASCPGAWRASLRLAVRSPRSPGSGDTGTGRPELRSANLRRRSGQLSRGRTQAVQGPGILGTGDPAVPSP